MTSLNFSGSLVAGQTWTSSKIDWSVEPYSNYNSFTISVLASGQITISVYVAGDFGGLGEIIETITTKPPYMDMEVLHLVKLQRYFSYQIRCGSSNVSTVETILRFNNNQIFSPLADNNGVPISILNKLNVNAYTTDISGNGITSTNNALNCYITGSGSNSSNNIHDSNGNTINATSGKLNVNQNYLTTTNDAVGAYLHDGSGNKLTSSENKLNVNQNYLTATNDAVGAYLYDGSGNHITSTTNKLNVNQNYLSATNDAVKANLYDGSGNKLTSTTGYLNVNVSNNTNLFSKIKDSAGNTLSATNGALRVADTINDIVNGLYNDGFNTQKVSRLICSRSVVSLSGSDINTIVSDAYPFSSFNDTVYCVSSNVNDDSSGTGAREIVIYGMDNAGVFASTIQTLNGTSNSTVVGITNSIFYAINGAYISQCGSSGANQGTLTIKTSTGNIEVCNIQPNLGTTLQGVLFVPSSIQSIIMRRAYIQTSSLMNVYFFVKKSGSTTWLVQDMCVVNGNTIKDIFLLLNAGDVFRVNAVALSTTGSCAVQIEQYITQ